MRIVERKRITYTEELIQVLYDHMSDTARTYIAESLAGKHGLALRIETPSIAKLLKVVGDQSNPHQCSPASIRFRYSPRQKPYRIDGWDWWENIMHRPVDMREATRDLQLIFPAN